MTEAIGGLIFGIAGTLILIFGVIAVYLAVPMIIEGIDKTANYFKERKNAKAAHR